MEFTAFLIVNSVYLDFRLLVGQIKAMVNYSGNFSQFTNTEDTEQPRLKSKTLKLQFDSETGQWQSPPQPYLTIIHTRV